MNRLAKVRHAMQEQGLDALLVHHNADLRWLLGFAGIFDEEDAHFCLITQEACLFHTDSRYINAFQALSSQAPDVVFTAEPKKVSEFVIAALEEVGIQGNLQLGFENDLPYCTWHTLEESLHTAGLAAKLVPTACLVQRLRAVKEPSELALIAQAQKITDAAFVHMMEYVEVGMTEQQVALELEYTMRNLGATGLAFPSIVAAAENGASPHSLPSTRSLQAGDMVVMDFGASFKDYCSDMTRSFMMGQPSEEQRRVYEVVLQAQTQAKAAIAPGQKCSDIHAIAAKIIEDASYGRYFGHALGHGVGIDIHESPNLSPVSDTILGSGNVVTVEPGIYLPGRFGVRIEDFGVVTEDGFETFTASTHTLCIR